MCGPARLRDSRPWLRHNRWNRWWSARASGWCPVRDGSPVRRSPGSPCPPRSLPRRAPLGITARPSAHTASGFFSPVRTRLLARRPHWKRLGAAFQKARGPKPSERRWLRGAGARSAPGSSTETRAEAGPDDGTRPVLLATSSSAAARVNPWLPGPHPPWEMRSWVGVGCRSGSPRCPQQAGPEHEAAGLQLSGSASCLGCTDPFYAFLATNSSVYTEITLAYGCCYFVLHCCE